MRFSLTWGNKAYRIWLSRHDLSAARDPTELDLKPECGHNKVKYIRILDVCVCSPKELPKVRKIVHMGIRDCLNSTLSTPAGPQPDDINTLRVRICTFRMLCIIFVQFHWSILRGDKKIRRTILYLSCVQLDRSLDCDISARYKQLKWSQ